MRIIADHIKAAVFIIGDEKGVTPSNMNQGYVVRRLIRRAIRHGKKLGISQENWTRTIAENVVRQFNEFFPELGKNAAYVYAQLDEEEGKFNKTLERGLKEFERIINSLSIEHRTITGKDAFDLYQTYGFPIEMTIELAREQELEINIKEYEDELEKHSELSRTASAGMFKGGLADAGDASRKYHTATHLLLSALRKVLGNHVNQKGSNITEDRLRFDFSHPEKLTDEQKMEVERLVNEAIDADLPVSCEEMTVEKAKDMNAVGVFESKYGEQVKVYTVGDDADPYSREICGGPHAGRTGELGKFKIKKEEASSAGVRRIKATLE